MKHTAKVEALRRAMVTHIAERIAREGWKQREAAARLGTSQSRISYLLAGKANSFTLDALLLMLLRIGKVSIKLKH